MRLSRMYRDYRIVLVRLGRWRYSWHAMVHDRTGAIIEKDIMSDTIKDAMAQAQWAVERHLAFRPLPRIKWRA